MRLRTAARRRGAGPGAGSPTFVWGWGRREGGVLGIRGRGFDPVSTCGVFPPYDGRLKNWRQPAVSLVDRYRARHRHVVAVGVAPLLHVAGELAGARGRPVAP